MWVPKSNGGRKGGNGLIAVAIDKEKSSHVALKWAVENLLVKGQTVILIHVLHKTSLSSSISSYSQVSDFSSAESPHRQHLERITKDIFLTFRCFCTCKDVQCLDVVLEDPDIVKALTEYVSSSAIENLVLGCSSRHGFIRKFKPDVAASVSKGAPDFCTVYVISKGKVSSVRNASRPAPFTSPLIHEIQKINEKNDDISDIQSRLSIKRIRERTSFRPRRSVEESFRSPIVRGSRGIPFKTLMDFSESDTDISFISSDRPSTDRTSSVGYDVCDSGRTSRLSTSSEHSLGSIRLGPRFMDIGSLNEFSNISQESGTTSCSCSSQGLIAVLSCIRHPNMVLLLGACPEYGILVYEYMAKGSLDDCLFRKGNTSALSWQQRFRIAAEIATGLLFLHQAKPEPIVHRDLKPGNILLDHNYVSKISDVGLARLVPVIAENVTQCRMTSTAGTFCYIDPEYQQTGMLGVKSDVYSLGIMLLQVITAKPAMGLTHHVEQAIEKGKFAEMLDPAVPDWPVEQALRFAKLALQCAELRRKDRPDLGKEVLPELNRLREFSEEEMTHNFLGGSAAPTPGEVISRGRKPCSLCSLVQHLTHVRSAISIDSLRCLHLVLPYDLPRKPMACSTKCPNETLISYTPTILSGFTRREFG